MVSKSSGLTMKDLLGDFMYQEMKTEKKEETGKEREAKEICEEVKQGWLPMDWESEEMEAEIDRQKLKKLCSQQARAMEPYIIRVLDELDFEESPIYEDELSSDLIEDITDQIYEQICNDYPQLEYRNSGMIQIRRNQYQNNMARDFLQFMILSEIFHNRRPNRRKCCGRNSNYGRLW